MNSTKARPVLRSEFRVKTWEERDRLHISAQASQVRYNVNERAYEAVPDTEETEVADWWDEDARQMFEDGFFRTPRRLPEERGVFEQSVFDYLVQMGVIREVS